MIPKIIHYCWLSDEPYPDKIRYCIDSWKRVLPDYEIRLWDAHRFDIESVAWVKEAYQSKKYAFAADYIRCYVLYHYGGIYLDSDVEVIKPFDDLLALSYFLGKERVSGCIEAATMGAEKGHLLFRYLMDYYENQHFIENGKPNTCVMPRIMQDIIATHFTLREIATPNDFVAASNTICLLPSDYFSPKENEQLYLTPNTYSIHHYAGTWQSPIYRKLRLLTLRLLGVKGKQWIAHLLHTYLHKQQ
ncbi:MAG: glycosyl transferase [Paludibacteraceae bacterium]|nr:glycosyl transferase [Paludibacteraceae bacterium]